MNAFEFISNYSNPIIALANIILIVFTFSQIRDSRKPIITTKILSPRISKNKEAYLVVSNISRKVATDVDIRYSFQLNDKTIPIREKVKYLNPNEEVRLWLRSNKIMDNFPDIFEEKSEGATTIKVPKKTLKIKVAVKVTYSPLFLKLFAHKINDEHEIEWGSLENYPDFKDHPVFDCRNIRDGILIHKIPNSVQNTTF